MTVHARKAWLGGLSPKENRTVPPLDHARVARLKRDFPGLEIIVNGGIADLDAAEEQLVRLDGVMIGRAAYQDPYMLAEADRRIFGEATPPPSRHAVARAYADYVAAELAAGERLSRMTRDLGGAVSRAAGCQGLAPALERARPPARCRRLGDHRGPGSCRSGGLIRDLQAEEGAGVGGGALG
ncbi:MAG: tRNA-dihydrouridine synthase [Arhodomonas sp.]|nr:tRNA-dihydrouridine synthase [Arhodomonas sp.]